MSLKAFHLIFVCLFTAMALGCAAWEARQYFSPTGTLRDLLFAIGSGLVAVGVVVYGRYFLKKMKRLSYL
jgi:hypothetical protein